MSAMVNSELPEVVPEVTLEIVRLVGLRRVRSACEWFRIHESQLCDWQLELARISAPPFGESARAEWLTQRFTEFDLEDVHTDEVGNVLGLRPGSSKECITISAHIDTVFPAGTPLDIRKEGSRLYGPGVSDNGAGVSALLGIAGALRSAGISNQSPILFVGNVGEEGEGDLRGIRHIFSDSPCKGSIAYSLILDGAGCDTIVSEALGSRRFEVIVRGPGGHSWSDFGIANPIPVLARAIHAFTQVSVPASPKTTFNIGVIRGGTSVNSIPESASMRVDIRSSSPSEMERLESALRSSIARAVDEECQIIEKRGSQQKPPYGLSFEVIGIGDRPAGDLNPNARILHVIRAVDAELGNVATVQRASTDANIPLSLGLEAIAIGGGGSGGGAHTLQEWFDCNGRELGLKRIMLALLALAGVGG
ncbi:MAG TPA: M20/M25/M40 family metallo-hydrolase [Terriglobales bacterium]|jgi:acetylornithine deacetylase/succinyl-diaminopimelate desuccinylase-like protein|nr:M20/M25/M40 family metallo-hydrolase [Terriglobales bacterium]